MEKTYERRREEERKVDKSSDREEDFVLLDLDNFMTLDAVGSVDGMFLPPRCLSVMIQFFFFFIFWLR